MSSFNERYRVVSLYTNTPFASDEGPQAVAEWKEQAGIDDTHTQLIDTNTGRIIVAGNRFSHVDQLASNALSLVA